MTSNIFYNVKEFEENVLGRWYIYYKQHGKNNLQKVGLKINVTKE